MARAVALAERGRGAAAPNPCVGAVLVRNEEVVAEGYHTACGKPHAERECLADARAKGVDPARCQMYVTLEPCNHHGRTPPCTEALLEAGVPKVFVGAMDPNDSVAGGGAARLAEAGVEVVAGVLERECLDLIADFRLWTTSARTYNVLKLAVTIDGRIAGRDRAPVAVTGPEAKEMVHDLRGRVDAVVVGGGTLYADDPRLSCRLPGERKDPLAVVVTSRLPDAGADLCLLRERPGRTVFFTGEDRASGVRARALAEIGATVYGLPAHVSGKGLDLMRGLERLRAEHGAYSVLCEGGGTLALSLARQGLADELRLVMAPRILGDEAAPGAFSGRGPAAMAETFDFRLARTTRLGQDVMLTFHPKE